MKSITLLFSCLMSMNSFAGSVNAFASTQYQCIELKNETHAIIKVTRKFSGEMKKISYQDAEVSFSRDYFWGREDNAAWLNASEAFDQNIFKHIDVGAATLGIELKQMQEDQSSFLAFYFHPGDSMKSGCGYYRTCTEPVRTKIYRCKIN